MKLRKVLYIFGIDDKSNLKGEIVNLVVYNYGLNSLPFFLYSKY